MHALQLREIMHAVDARGIFRRGADAAAVAERAAALNGSARAPLPVASCGPRPGEGAQPGAAGRTASAEGAAAPGGGAQAAAPAACSGGAPSAGAQPGAGSPALASVAEPAACAANGVGQSRAAQPNGRAAGGAANGGDAGHAGCPLVADQDNSFEGVMSAPQSDEEGLVSAAAGAGGAGVAPVEAGGCGRDRSPPPPPPADGAGPTSASGGGGGDGGARDSAGTPQGGVRDPAARRTLPQSEDEAYARIREALAATDARLARLHAALQPNALLLLLGCQGDTFEVRRLQARRCHLKLRQRRA